MTPGNPHLKRPSDQLAQGEFPTARKARPEPAQDGDWLAFDDAPQAQPKPAAPNAPAPTDPHFQSLGIDVASWEQATQPKRHRIPAPGPHTCVVHSAWLKAPASGGGEVLNILLEVLEGPDQGATVLAVFSIKSTNPRAKAIALYKLGQLTASAGMTTPPQKIGDLAGLVCGVIVSHKPHWLIAGEIQPYAAKFFQAEAV